MARSESSEAASVRRATRASVIEWLSAFRLDGRSSVSRRTSPSRAAVTAPMSVTVESAHPELYGYPYSIAILYKLARKGRMAEDTPRYGEQPLAQTVAAAGALRRLTGLLLSLEHEHPTVDVMLAQFADWERELAGAVAPDP